MKMRFAATILMLTFVTAVLALTPAVIRAAEQKQAAPATAAQKPGVVATVNGSDIPVDDFYRELYRVQRLVLQTGKPLTCPQLTRLRTEVAEGLVRRELLYQEAKKSVKVTEAEINDEMKKLKGQYANEGDFTNALSAMKVSPESLRAQVERALLIQKLIEIQFASKAVVTDKDIWAYYDRNRDSFRQPEQVRASQILIKVDPQWDQAKKAAARKKIEDIKQKIQQKQDFEFLARPIRKIRAAPKAETWGISEQARC